MYGGRLVKEQTQAVYCYDGSFEGFLCCVYDSVYRHEMPLAITQEEDYPSLLGSVRFVAADPVRAERVRASIPAKISPRALELCVNVFCSCLEGKELLLLRFLLRGYREGGSLCYKLGDELVSKLVLAERHLLHEAHLLKGFTRFVRAPEAMVAFITPKNYVLPYLAQHFCLRMRKENFAIVDKTHRTALVYRRGKAEILRVERIEPPALSPGEIGWQTLWRRFYDTIAIEGRENPRCRMRNMPKRYWENMPEVAHLGRSTSQQ